MTVRCKLCGRKVTHGSCVACGRAMRLMRTSDVAMRVATAMMVKEGSVVAIESPRLVCSGKLVSPPTENRVIVDIEHGELSSGSTGFVRELPEGLTYVRLRSPCNQKRHGSAKLMVVLDRGKSVVAQLDRPLNQYIPTVAVGDTVFFYVR